MHNSRQYLIKPATESLLLAHGLMLEIDQDEYATSPREHSDSVFVGGEVDVPQNIDKGASFDEFVANYCRDILSCKTSDIVWSAVTKYSHGSVKYYLGETGCQWDSSIIGFIYLTKQQVRELYSVKSITKKTIDEVLSRFEDELKDYTSWANGELLALQVTGKADDSFYARYDSIRNEDDLVDETANELISCVLSYVNNDSRSLADLTLKIDQAAIPKDTPPMAHILPLVQERFGFTPLLGDTAYDVNTGILSVFVDIESMPSILKTAANTKARMFDGLWESVYRFNHEGCYSRVEHNAMMEWCVGQYDYNDLPAMITAAYITTLFNHIDGVLKVESVKVEETSIDLIDMT